MTVAELNDRISPVEYQQWRAFHTFRHAMQEQEIAKAQAVAKVRRR